MSTDGWYEPEQIEAETKLSEQWAEAYREATGDEREDSDEELLLHDDEEAEL